LRIISGTHRGRNINPPAGLPVRPTTDFAKEGLFNVLQHQLDFEEIEVLDLFCGTGNISFEFASRGCEPIISVDADYGCISFIKKTTDEFEFNITAIKIRTI
jgi:16S rRNA G966 N2-methylase RsmD